MDGESRRLGVGETVADAGFGFEERRGMGGDFDFLAKVGHMHAEVVRVFLMRGASDVAE